ncbi:hypothetical protein K1719_013976 [Acacia pycnantha]|nr:hypothetical protein K1719_039249 [Acacia pycnantha]KAI9114963.1 hypothetical protein K1719_013976 [Acacia pycnantha]
MAKCGRPSLPVTILLLLFILHATARKVPGNTRHDETNNQGEGKILVHASAPALAESPMATGIADKKHFIVGGVGGFAGMGGFAGVGGIMPKFGIGGGLGKFGGIGGFIGGHKGFGGGIGGLGGGGPGGGLGGLGGGAGGLGGLGGGAGGLGGAGGVGGVGGAGGIGGGLGGGAGGGGFLGFTFAMHACLVKFQLGVILQVSVLGLISFGFTDGSWTELRDRKSYSYCRPLLCSSCESTFLIGPEEEGSRIPFAIINSRQG